MDRKRQVPRTDRVLADPALAEAIERLGRALVKQAVAAAQDRVRRGELDPGSVVAATLEALSPQATSLRPVINATGVLVHTNLGRAPLSAAAVAALAVAAGTTDVELDLDTGRRGRRGSAALAALVAAVPPAEMAHVVNNNAAALALTATALAQGREIVVSRGELVEIGDGFRIPDLLTATGATLVEVGTTNRTGPADYAAAMGERTGFVLKVHPSNFVVSGFTAAADVTELAGLCRANRVPLVVDIGSGLLAREPALPNEPDVATMLRDGADLVTASGDKLLGGPQCGLLLGRAAVVERLRRHPLARAVRVDKLTLAALEATLRGPTPPVSRMLHSDVTALRRRAARLVDELRAAEVDAEVVDSAGAVGGGGAPGVTLLSAAISLPSRYADVLRRGEPAVLGHVAAERLLLDLRTVEPDDDDLLMQAMRRAMKDA